MLATISLVATTTTTVISCRTKSDDAIIDLKKQLEDLKKQKEDLIEDHDKELKERQKDLNKLNQKITLRDKEISELNTLIFNKEKQIVDFKRKVNEMTEAIEDKEKTLNEKQQEYENLSQKYQKKNEELKNLNQDFETKEKEVSFHKQNIEKLQKQIESQNIAIQQKQKNINILIRQNNLNESRIGKLSNLLEEAKLKKHNLETEITSLNGKLYKNANEIANLEIRVQNLETEKQKLAKLLADAQQKISNFEKESQNKVWSEIDDLILSHNALIQFKQKVLEFETELKNKNVSLQEKNDQLENKRIENENLQNTITRLEQENLKIEKQSIEIKNELKKVNQIVAEKIAEIANLKSENEQLSKSKSEIESALRESRNQNSQLSKLKCQLDEQLKQINKTLQAKNTENAMLQKDKQALEKEIENLNIQLAKAINSKRTMQQEIDTLRQEKQSFESHYNLLKQEYEQISKSFRFKQVFKKELEPAFWSLLDTEQSDLKIRQNADDYNQKQNKYTDKNFYVINNNYHLKKQDYFYNGIREFLLEFMTNYDIERDQKYWKKLTKTESNIKKYEKFRTSDNVYLTGLANPDNLKLVQNQMQLWLNDLKTNSNYHQKYFGRAKYWINLLNPVVKVYHLTKEHSNVRNLVSYRLKDGREYTHSKSTRFEISLQPQIKSTDSPEDKLIKKIVYGNKKFFDLARIDFTNDWYENGMYAFNEEGPTRLSFDPKDYNRGLYEEGYYSNGYSIRIRKFEKKLDEQTKNDRLSLLGQKSQKYAKWFFSIKFNE